MMPKKKTLSAQFTLHFYLLMLVQTAFGYETLSKHALRSRQLTQF